MDFLNAPIGVWIAAILTIMVYSYLLGDNPLYRLAEHLLVGSAVAYAVVVAVHTVLIPRLFDRLSEGQMLYLVPLVLGLLLFAKVKPSWSVVGNISMAFLIGVGAALAMSGALLGTIWPQVKGTFVSLNPADHPASGWPGVLNALIVVIGTIGALLYFYFSTGATSRVGRLWTGFVALWAKVGRVMIMVAFGAIFASLVMSRVSLFVGRLKFILGDWLNIIHIP